MAHPHGRGDGAAPERRQFVRFLFLKVDPAWRGLPPSVRRRQIEEFAATVEGFPGPLLVRSYSLVGTRGDADLMLWLVAEDLETLHRFQAALQRTGMAPYLTYPYSYLAMTRRSLYEVRGAPEGGTRLTVNPQGARYLFVYPFVKTRAWYKLNQATRQGMMDEHIAVGRRYPSVKLNTTYSYGLDDQEFVVAFETDEPADFLDLVMELRFSDASQYTERDTPIFTCLALPLRACLEALGGVPEAAARPEPTAPEPAPGEGPEGGPTADPEGFRPVLSLEELPDGGRARAFVGGHAVALFRVGERIYVLEDRCSHARGPLSEGRLEGGWVVCPWHDARFELETGRAAGPPARGPVATFRVKVAGGRIWVHPEPQRTPAPVAGAGGGDLDDLDRRLLNRLQRAFPLTATPWEALGEALGVDGAEVLSRVRRLKEAGYIRQISAIFDTKALGYKSSLVAARVAPERIEEAAAVLNRHPGVSHNYQREHPFQLWFTLAVPPGESLEAHVERLAREAGLEAVRLLPTLRLYKIGVTLEMEKDERTLHRERREEGVRRREVDPAALPPLTERDRAFVRVLQEDLPLEPRPFDVWAARLGVPVEEVFAWMEAMKAQGRMRRFAAILRHRRAGFRANGMIVWRVPEEIVDEVGLRAAAFPQVTHCYRRPTYPDWPYNLFTMVHARSREACEAIAREMSRELGIDEYAILYSTREFKKTRVRYFTEEWAAWRLGEG